MLNRLPHGDAIRASFHLSGVEFKIQKARPSFVIIRVGTIPYHAPFFANLFVFIVVVLLLC